MRLYLIKRKLDLYWKRKSVRAIVVIVVVAVALAIQYYLAHIPEPLNLGAGGNNIVPAVMPGQQLLIEGLTNDPLNVLLVSHKGNSVEEVDVHLSAARLSPATLAEYQSLTPPPPSNSTEIACSSTNSEPGGSNPNGAAPCSTSINIRMVPSKGTPASIKFFQTDTTGGERYRQLVMQVHQMEPVVTLKMVPDPSPQSNRNDVSECVKSLRVSEWHQEISDTGGGGYDIGMIMAPESSLRLRFTPLGSGALWSGGSDGLFEPFLFSSSGIATSNMNSPIEGYSVSIVSISDKKVVFRAKSAGTGRISVDNLKVGSDRLLISARGNAYVQVNGKSIPVDLSELIKQYWLISGFLAMGNTALLVWIVRVVKSLFSSSIA